MSAIMDRRAVDHLPPPPSIPSLTRNWHRACAVAGIDWVGDLWSTSIARRPRFDGLAIDELSEAEKDLFQVLIAFSTASAAHSLLLLRVVQVTQRAVRAEAKRDEVQREAQAKAQAAEEALGHVEQASAELAASRAAPYATTDVLEVARADHRAAQQHAAASDATIADLQGRIAALKSAEPPTRSLTPQDPAEETKAAVAIRHLRQGEETLRPSSPGSSSSPAAPPTAPPGCARR